MKINEVYFNWLSDGGIFTDLNAFDLPWKNDNTPINLDMVYHGTRSGCKHISPLVKTMLQTDNTNVLSTARRTQLATTIYQMFIDKWTKLYNTLSFEYDPINNYDMTETETVSGSTSDTRLNTGTQTTADTGTQTNDHDGTSATAHTGTQGTSETNTVTGSGETDNRIFGFNSSTGKDDSGSETSSTNTGTGSSTRTDNLTDTRTDNLTDTRTDNLLSTRTDNLSESNSGSHSESRSLTRSGNIGVTTSQQMIQSERDLDNYNVFYDGVFSDIDKVLTIATY